MTRPAFPSTALRLQTAALLLACASFAAAAAPKDIPAFAGGDYHKYWMDVCSRCHGANGNGRDNSGAQLPDAGFDFTDSRKANRKKDNDWVKTTLEGKDKMPAFKGKMTEEQVRKMIADILRPFAAKG